MTNPHYKILFVDDNLFVLNSYKRSFRNLFELDTAHSGKSALAKLQTDGPFAAIISDMRMPEMTGYEFLKEAYKVAPETTQIVLTGYADINDAMRTINEANVFKYLIKPCENDLLLNAIKSAIRQYQLAINEKELLNKTLKGIVQVLIEMLSLTNPETFSPNDRVKRIANFIAQEIELETDWKLEISVLLSQIGKVLIPSEIIEKKRLGREMTQDEKLILDSHTKFAKEILMNIPRLDEVAENIFHQNVHYDGSNSGSDDTKKENDIPLISRILKVAIDFDELLTDSKSNKEAFEVLKINKTGYDPDILFALEKQLPKLGQINEIKEINSKDIDIGMVLADHIYRKDQSILIKKDQEITEILKIRVRQLSILRKIIEPIKILEH
jgi:response regulator RpfG family c-di-GMP phosphodiesterase